MSNGKGDKPRNCFSKRFKDNYEQIKWKTNEDKTRLQSDIQTRGDGFETNDRSGTRAIRDSRFHNKSG